MDEACEIVHRVFERIGPNRGPIALQERAGVPILLRKSDDILGKIVSQLGAATSSHHGDVTATQTSILRECGNLFLVMLSVHVSAHVSQHHAGGGMMAWFAADVWRRLQFSCDSSPRVRIVDELRQLKTWIGDYVMRLAKFGHGTVLSVQDGRRSVTATMLASLGHQAQGHLGKLILRALDVITMQGIVYPNRLRPYTVVDPREDCWERCELLDGLIVDRQLHGESEFLLKRHNGSISGFPLLFTCCLTDQASGKSLTLAIRKHNIRILLCQKTVDVPLKRRLFSLGVVVVERLSIHHVNHVAACVSCESIGFETSDVNEWNLDAVRERHTAILWRATIASHTVTRISVLDKPSITTLVLVVPSAAVADMVERQVMECFRACACVTSKTVFTQSAGWFEEALSRYLSCRQLLGAPPCRALERTEMQLNGIVLDAVLRSLRSFATLCSPQQPDLSSVQFFPIAIAASNRSRSGTFPYSEAEEPTCFEGIIPEMSWDGFLDNATVKHSALNSALEVVETVLRIRSIRREGMIR